MCPSDNRSTATFAAVSGFRQAGKATSPPSGDRTGSIDVNVISCTGSLLREGPSTEQCEPRETAGRLRSIVKITPGCKSLQTQGENVWLGGRDSKNGETCF